MTEITGPSLDRRAYVHNAITGGLAKAGDWVPLSVRAAATRAALTEVDAWYAAGEQPTAPSVPADRDLRDRIRRAICEACGFAWLPDELMEPDEYGEHADAVLAILPAPADRAAVLREAADEAEAENARCNAVGPCQQCSARTTIAIRLRRMADEAQVGES